MTYLGYVSRSAYLEALRQECLEEAERCEHLGRRTARMEFRDMAARLGEQIQDEEARGVTNAAS